MKKVLIVLEDLRVGNGIASSIMNYYDALLTEYEVSFLVLQDVQSKNIDYVKNCGSRIYVMPTSKIKYTLKTINYLNKFFNNNQFDIIHVNIPGPYGALILKKAKKYGVQYRVYHSHNPKNNLTLKSSISSSIYNNFCIRRANRYLACSNTAGKSIFKTREFSVLRNCIDAEKFSYDVTFRQEIRKGLGITNDTVLFGYVGRLEKQKNPLFAIKCFNKYLYSNNNAFFVIVGDGSMKKSIQRLIEKYKISNKVKMVGTQNNVGKWYSAMDCFLLPSKFEGLGIVFIEAQASGLPCFTSTHVPDDIELTNLVNRIDTKKGIDYFSNQLSSYEFFKDRAGYVEEVKKNNYDIRTEREELLKYYNKFK